MRRGGWGPYVPVNRRREIGKTYARMMAKKGEKLEPVAIEGRAISKTFWGKAWADNLESYSDFSNRMPRGRTYARNGSILDLKIKPGRVEAKVIGSVLYTIQVHIETLSAKKWSAIKAKCRGHLPSLLELLSGQMSDEVMRAVSQRGQGLFPEPKEIDLNCSCPDWAEMCKHVAAALYGVAARLDEDPALLFTLRGVNPEELVDEKNLNRSQPHKPTAQNALNGTDLADLFGIEFASEASAPAKPRARGRKTSAPDTHRPSPKRQATRTEKKKGAPKKSPPARKSAKPKPPNKSTKKLTSTKNYQVLRVVRGN